MNPARIFIVLALVLAGAPVYADSAGEKSAALSTAVARENAIADLSQGDAGKGVVIPDAAIAAGKDTAQWNLERANLCLSAASVAKAGRNSPRMKVLATEAERSLQAARASGTLTVKEQAQCSLNLGNLAERRADAAAAAAYYAESLQADPGNKQAAGALRRAQEILAYRASLQANRSAR
ncbi:MAG TPA: hypothetical protein VG838_02560 [Opitutaceae bacterium]|nr:hypothetical protein [Opitutaceae bacterium]